MFTLFTTIVCHHPLGRASFPASHFIHFPRVSLMVNVSKCNPQQSIFTANVQVKCVDSKSAKGEEEFMFSVRRHCPMQLEEKRCQQNDRSLILHQINKVTPCWDRSRRAAEPGSWPHVEKYCLSLQPMHAQTTWTHPPPLYSQLAVNHYYICYITVVATLVIADVVDIADPTSCVLPGFQQDWCRQVYWWMLLPASQLASLRI